MTGRERQTAADLAVERCGSAEAMFAVVRRNGIPIDAEVAGMELADTAVADRRTRELIAAAGVNPAGMYDPRDDVLTTDDGSENVVTKDDETIVQ